MQYNRKEETNVHSFLKPFIYSHHNDTTPDQHKLNVEYLPRYDRILQILKKKETSAQCSFNVIFGYVDKNCPRI